MLVVLSAARSSPAIPLAALAGVLMVTAVRMVEVHNVRAVLRATRPTPSSSCSPRSRRSPSTSSSRSSSASRLAALLALRNVAARPATVTNPCPVEGVDGDVEQRALLRDHIVAYRIDGALFFGAAQRFLTELTAVADVRVVILRLPDLQVLDATGAQALGEIVAELEHRRITVLLKGPRPEHLRLLGAVGALDRLAHENHVFSSLTAAVATTRVHANRAPRRRRVA